MSTIYPQVPEQPVSTVRALPGVMTDGQGGPPGSGPGHGNTEAGFLSGPGKSLYRRLVGLLSQIKDAAAREGKSREAAGRSRRAADERRTATAAATAPGCCGRSSVSASRPRP